MTPAAQVGSRGSESSPPTMTSEPRGSLTIAERKLSCWVRKHSKRSTREPGPRSGPPLTISRVGSPPVWESITRTRWRSLVMVLSCVSWIRYAGLPARVYSSFGRRSALLPERAGRNLERPDEYRAVENSFEQMAFGGDGLGGRSERRITLGGDNHSLVSFCSDVITFNLNTANVAVVPGV